MSTRNTPPPVVVEVSDEIIGFYVGRDLTGGSPLAGVEGNWIDVEWALGEINYALCAGDRAVVYDTMALPELGQWVREYLHQERGIRRFTVVLSHWHLDHIAGNPSYRDSPIVSLALTRQTLVEQQAVIEAGTLWGPPALEVVLPQITFENRLDLHLGDLRVELHRFDIHSRDANLLYIPEQRTLLAGDALEDPITYIVEPDGISTHIAELDRLKSLPIDRIYPQHGDPETIRHGGYTTSFIDAMGEYNHNMLRNLRQPDYLAMPIEAFIPNALAADAVTLWEPYRTIHTQNLRLLDDHYRDKPLPTLQ